jgi:prepilin-type processing-associated H-X9-DG protein
MDRETTIIAENLLGNKISLRDTKAVVLLRKAAKATAAIKDKSAENKRVTQKQFEALVDMLTSKGYLRILMNPRIQVVDGKTAKISSSQHVPLQVITKTIPGAAGLTTIVSTETEYIDVVDSIEITPHVFADGHIILQVEATISSKSIPKGVEQIPTITTREVSTLVTTSPGESLMIIGGLKETGKSSETDRNVKGPKEKSKEVLFILTPTIISPSTDSQEKTDVRIKVKPDKTLGKLAANRAFFTPPIARIINSAVERKDCFIDFDNDKLYSQPSDFHSRAREQQEAWKRENSIDASATVSEGAEGLWGEEMVIIPLADVEFDRMTPASFRDVLQQATPGTPAVMTAIGQLPKTYVFKTREGGMGLLQILEVQRKRSPHYIKIRYKMVPRTVEADVKITSNKNLQDLGKAMVMFARDHQRKLPDSLQDFAPYLRNKRDIKWLSQKVKYLGKGKTENDRPDTVIAYDSSLLLSQQGTNVLFLDAHVEYVQADRLEKLGISETAILIETRLLSLSEDFLQSIGLDANSVHSSDAWSEHLVADSAAEPNSETYSLILDELHIRFLLKAVQAHQGSKMLVAPRVLRVLTREGTTATMAIMTEEYFVIGYTEPNGPSDEPVPKLDKVEVGTRIWLKPELTPDKENVRLDFKLEIRQLLGYEERKYKGKYKYIVPLTEVVSTQTQLLVPDGKTLLIGGLKINEKVESRSGVPLLSKLPVVGGLFKRRTITDIKDHKMLLILVKPIINPQQKASKILPGEEDSEEHIKSLARQLEKKLNPPAEPK